MSQLVEGQILDDRYLIGATIARGGMSTVYCATDLRLDRRVAAKVMDPRFVDDDSFRIRFEREARAVAHLNDESLVNVYDQGTDPAGHVFLIMEFVDGGTLRELLRQRGPMPPHAAAAVMQSVLHALSVAHSRGMVHRDIKPENVLISADGKVKLADFGLVRAAADTKVTSNSIIVGTVAYLSPEQVTGEPISPASDVYSAGILLFELLTGSTPFEADTSLGVAMKRLNENVPSPSDLIDGVSEEFDELVARACARRREDRFASAQEFADELEVISNKLNLPPFRVPAPTNSAAANAAARESVTESFRRDDGFAPVSRESTLDRFESDAYDDYELDSAEGGSTSAINASAINRTRAYPTQEHFDLAGWEGAAPASGTPAELKSEPPHPVNGVPPEHPQPRSNSSRSPEPRVARRHRGSRQRTRRGCALWLVIALIATLGIGLGAWWLGSGRYGEVPSITGLSQPQAMSAISDAGFEPIVDERYDNTITASQIIGSEPMAGERAVRGDNVLVLVSLGRPIVPAYPPNRSPQVFSDALAQRTLREKVGDPVFSDDIATGNVVSAEPTPGQAVDVGSTVVVHYSKGSAPVKVPKVTGLDEDKARDILEKTGLEVRTSEKGFSSSAEPGEVLAVTPDVGTGLEHGSYVTLTVNSGIRVPDVVGKSENSAIKILERAGISVTEVLPAQSPSRSYGHVEQVSPAAGNIVDPDNATVSITVSRAVKVPRLMGKTVGQARREAEERHLELEIDSAAGDSDRILMQSPRPGATASEGDTVKVTAL